MTYNVEYRSLYEIMATSITVDFMSSNHIDCNFYLALADVSGTLLSHNTVTGCSDVALNCRAYISD